MTLLKAKVNPLLTISKEVFLILQRGSYRIAVSNNNKIDNPLAKLIKKKEKRHTNVRNKKTGKWQQSFPKSKRGYYEKCPANKNGKHRQNRKLTRKLYNLLWQTQ